MLGTGIANKMGLGRLASIIINQKNLFSLNSKLKKNIPLVEKRNKTKIFIIGLNKTGTTSLGKTLEDFGYMVGNQLIGEVLFDEWLKRDFKKLSDFCKTAEVFQDAPFSFPDTYLYLDQKYPDSKFILTVRDSPEQWYQSLITFHGDIWGNGNIPPTSNDLKEATYLYKGFPLHFITKLFKTSIDDPYNKEILIKFYNTNIENVIKHFKNNPNKLLVLNISIKEDFKKLCDFLNIETKKTNFPHISSSNISNKEYNCEFLKTK